MNTISSTTLYNAARRSNTISITLPDGTTAKIKVSLAPTPKKERAIAIANRIAAGSGVHFGKNPEDRRQMVFEYEGRSALATILTPRDYSETSWRFNVQGRLEGDRMYVFLLQTSADDEAPKAVVLDSFLFGCLKHSHSVNERLDEVNLRFTLEDGHIIEQCGSSIPTDLTGNVDAFKEMADRIVYQPVF